MGPWGHGHFAWPSRFSPCEGSPDQMQQLCQRQTSLATGYFLSHHTSIGTTWTEGARERVKARLEAPLLGGFCAPQRAPKSPQP